MRLLVISFSLVLLASSAHAHEWFDSECCSDRDCRIAKPGEVTLKPDGVHVDTDQLHVIVSYSSSQVRPTRDPENRAALCTGPKLYETGDYLLCVYIPGGQV